LIRQFGAKLSAIDIARGSAAVFEKRRRNRAAQPLKKLPRASLNTLVPVIALNEAPLS